MRFPIIPTIFLLLLAVSAAVIVPNSVRFLPGKADLVRQLSTQSGLRVQISGDMRLRFLPRPQLILEDVVIQRGDGEAQSLRTEMLILDLAPIDLARGDITIIGINFLKADVTLALAKGAREAFVELAQFAYPDIRFLKSQAIVSGLDRFDRARQIRLTDLDVRLPARRRDDDFIVTIRREGEGGREARFQLAIGNVTGSRQDVAMDLTLAPDEKIEFDGFSSSRAGRWRADGEVVLDSARMVTDVARATLPVEFAPPAKRVAFSGLIQADEDGIRTENLEIAALGSVFQSRLALDWPTDIDTHPILNGRLTTGTINLDQLSVPTADTQPPLPEVSAIWSAFERNLNLVLRLEATRFDIGGESGQNLLLEFDWDDEKLNVERLSLDLPFRSLFLASGAVDLGDGGPSFTGSFSARSTDALGAYLWLGDLGGYDGSAFVEVLDDTRLQRLSLVGDVVLSPNRLQLDALSGRLGEDRLSADAKLDLSDGLDGDVRLQIERFDLADWGVIDNAATNEQSIVGALFDPVNQTAADLLSGADKNRNLQFDFTTAALSAGVNNLGPAQISGAIENQSLVVRRLELAAFNGVSISADGRMNYEAAPPHGTVRAKLSGEGATQAILGRVLRDFLPLQIAETTQFDLQTEWRLAAPDEPDWPNTAFRGSGRLDNVETDFLLSGPARDLSFAAKGQKLDLTMQGPATDIAQLVNISLPYEDAVRGSLKLNLENQSSNVAKLVADLNLGDDVLSLNGTARSGAAGLRLEGAMGFQMGNVIPLLDGNNQDALLAAEGNMQIASDADSLSFSSLAARIGGGTLTGEGVVKFADTAPKLNANIVADNLDFAFLVPQAGQQGWSVEPMTWTAFARGDMDVDFGGTNIQLGTITLQQVAARLKLLGGVLEAPQITGRIMDGSFEADLLAEGGTLNPYFNLQSRFTGLRPAQLFNRLYGSTPIDAPTDGTFSLTGRGTTMRNMMASLSGDLQINLAAGIFTFTDLDAFAEKVLDADFEGEAAKLLRGDVVQLTPFERGVGLAEIRDGQMLSATVDFVFNEASERRDGRFDGQVDFVSRDMAAELTLYPTGSERNLLWQIIGNPAKPQIKVDASAFDRLPEPVPENTVNVSAPN